MNKRRKVLPGLLVICLLFALSFTTVTETGAVNANAATRINMNTFKKKSIQTWLENMCYVITYKNTTELKKKLPTIVRRDFLYNYRDRYKKYSTGLNMLVPKKVVHNYIYNIYGIRVNKVNLPVKKGKYLLKELWWQDETTTRFYKAVRTKTGATITLKKDVFGTPAGRNVVTVRPANNPRGFVITSIKYYPSNAQSKPTISVNTGSTGNSTCAINVTCSSGGTITWKTSNSSVATVDSAGNVTAKGTGTAVITATVNVNGKTYSVSKIVEISSRKQYGSWSAWSLNPEYGNNNQEVRTTALYRYYCFLCPVCGGREPLQGTSDCHKYNLTLANGVVVWSTTPYSACASAPYSYANYKRYTFSLGDGQRWNFSTGNINDHAIGTKDSDSAAIVIKTGYSKRSVSTVYYISAFL